MGLVGAQKSAANIPTLFESDHLLVRADLRRVASVVVGFSTYAEDRPVEFGNGVVQKLGHAGVFVTAKDKDWWQNPDMAAVCDLVRRATEGYATRIGYGGSMGGYGVLLFGADMGLHRGVLGAPQVAVSDPALPLAPEWAREIVKRPVLRDDVLARPGDMDIDVLYDPTEPIDAAHVRRLAASRPVTLVPLPLSGHKLFRTLLECRILPQIVTRHLAAPGGAAATRATYRAARHLSPGYVTRLAARLTDLGRDTACLARAYAELVPAADCAAYDAAVQSVRKRRLANRRIVRRLHAGSR